MPCPRPHANTHPIKITPQLMLGLRSASHCAQGTYNGSGPSSWALSFTLGPDCGEVLCFSFKISPSCFCTTGRSNASSRALASNACTHSSHMCSTGIYASNLGATAGEEGKKRAGTSRPWKVLGTATCSTCVERTDGPALKPCNTGGMSHVLERKRLHNTPGMPKCHNCLSIL